MCKKYISGIQYLHKDDSIQLEHVIQQLPVVSRQILQLRVHPSLISAYLPMMLDESVYLIEERLSQSILDYGFVRLHNVRLLVSLALADLLLLLHGIDELADTFVQDTLVVVHDFVELDFVCLGFKDFI